MTEPPPPPPPSSDRSLAAPASWEVRPPGRPAGRGFAIALVAFALVALVGFGACAAVSVVVSVEADPITQTTTTDAPQRPEPPAAWDPVVEPIAAFVADARGLAWEHPVSVRFLEDEEFVAEVVSDENELTEEDRESIAESQALLEALSLLPSGVDLFSAFNDASAAAVAGYYNPADGEIVMRGTDLTPAMRATLAHELTHALQDQHFDLGALREESADAGTTLGFISVVEGDASRIEEEYVLALPPEERELVYELAPESAAALGNLEGVPEIVRVLLGAPYAMGPWFVEAVGAAEGQEGIDALFTPEITEADVLTPIRRLRATPVADVDAPPLPDGADELREPEPFGAIGWYLVLAARLDAAAVLPVVDRWAGDSFVLYELDDRTCLAAAYRGDTSAATTDMHDLLEDWRDAGPPSDVEILGRDDDVVLRACATDEAGSGPTESLAEAIGLAVLRSVLFWQMLDAGAPTEVAWCVADEVAFDPELAPIFRVEEPGPDEQALVEERVAAATGVCLV